MRFIKPANLTRVFGAVPLVVPYAVHLSHQLLILFSSTFSNGSGEALLPSALSKWRTGDLLFQLFAFALRTARICCLRHRTRKKTVDGMAFGTIKFVNGIELTLQDECANPLQHYKMIADPSPPIAIQLAHLVLNSPQGDGQPH